MFAKCKLGKDTIKLCPFRVVQEVKSPTITTQTFPTCIGPKCAAYNDGYCLRLRSE